VRWELSDNVEWSLNVKTKVFIKFSFLGWKLPFINVDYIPLLVDLSVLVPCNDVSVLSINTTMNIHNLSMRIDEVCSIKVEELPPS
jgi:hypothetical protein